MDLGLERAGMRVVWQSEIDPYACRVLRKHWPDVPQLGDARRIDYAGVERPDVLAGGFACQDISAAGAMEGIEGDTRSGITWRELVRAVRCLRPRYVLVENVPTLLSGGDGRWFGTVLGELASLGYGTEWDCLPAAAFGAPHRRDRVFLVAHPERGGLQGGVLERAKPPADLTAARHRDSYGYQFGGPWSLPQPGLLLLDDGIPARVVENGVRGLGNAVVPAVAEFVGGLIVNHACATGLLNAA
jgi:DNA (cytosine-5)-methyltransferase 1